MHITCEAVILLRYAIDLVKVLVFVFVAVVSVEMVVDGLGGVVVALVVVGGFLSDCVFSFSLKIWNELFRPGRVRRSNTHRCHMQTPKCEGQCCVSDGGEWRQLLRRIRAHAVHFVSWRAKRTRTVMP